MSLAGGLIYVVFGWLDPESLVFSAGRVIFVLSLMLFGIYLLLRGTKIKKADTVTPHKN
jgi:ABC-type multidrug transport system permease subunit